MQRSQKTSVKTLIYVGAVLVVSLSTNSGWAADSLKTRFSSNGHYYQRFDEASVYWSSAKIKCENLSGHLVTITSSNEQDFVTAVFLQPDGDLLKGYHIGGRKVSNKWQWITGEAWNYTNWYQGHPFDVGTHLSIYNASYWLDKDIVKNIDGYICEWDAKNFLSSIIVPDSNGNGKVEFATLYRNGKTNAHIVEIKDTDTGKLFSKSLSFPAAAEPSIGMVALKNIESISGSAPEIGVLIYTGTATYLQIKDDKSNVFIKNITFLDSNYKPISISVTPDTNANGSDEVAVFGVHKTTGKGVMQMRDSKTKAILKAISF